MIAYTRPDELLSEAKWLVLMLPPEGLGEVLRLLRDMRGRLPKPQTGSLMERPIGPAITPTT